MKDWKNISNKLKTLSSKEFVILVRDLYASGETNRKFLAARFLNDQASLKKYKEQIHAAIYPDYNDRNACVQIREAKKAVSDFEKATGDSKQTIGLMVFFIEVGMEAMKTFGMDYAEFYSGPRKLDRLLR